MIRWCFLGLCLASATHADVLQPGEAITVSCAAAPDCPAPTVCPAPAPAPAPTPVPIPVPAPVPAPQVLFQDGFESGDARAWSGRIGFDGYVNDGCHSGHLCGTMKVPGGSTERGSHWYKDLQYSGPVFYVSAWWKFPVGYSFSGAPGYKGSHDHKAIIINAGSSDGRFILSFYNENGELSYDVERIPDQDFRNFTGALMPRDNQWHHVEVELTRGTSTGHIRVWLDGRMISDVARKTCVAACTPVGEVQIGAYVNQGAPVDEVFWMDDISMGSARP